MRSTTWQSVVCRSSSFTSPVPPSSAYSSGQQAMEEEEIRHWCVMARKPRHRWRIVSLQCMKHLFMLSVMEDMIVWVRSQSTVRFVAEDTRLRWMFLTPVFNVIPGTSSSLRMMTVLKLCSTCSRDLRNKILTSCQKLTKYLFLNNLSLKGLMKLFILRPSCSTCKNYILYF